MSQSTTATTTTPPIKAVYCSTSFLTTTVTLAPTLTGLLATSGQHDGGSATTADAKGIREGLLVSPLCCSDNLRPRCLLRDMLIMAWVLHMHVSLSELSLPLIWICMLVPVWCILSAFRCHARYNILHQWGSTVGDYTIAALQRMPMADICASW